MGGNPVLVDSSYYIGLSRQGIDPLAALAAAAGDRDLATCGIVRCEVGRGIKSPKALKRFKAFWEVMLYVPMDNSLWEAVEGTLWDLDRKGTTLPLQDVVIGCCALRIDAVVLTLDGRFRLIPGVTATDRLV